jgi:hypothetical protein
LFALFICSIRLQTPPYLSRYLLALRREARAVEAEIAAVTQRLGEA